MEKKYELYHHGILGMKWGVRRFQNPDGSLTAAGKQRYYSDKESKEIYDQLKSTAHIKKFGAPFGIYSGKRVAIDYKDNAAIQDAKEFLNKQNAKIEKTETELLDHYRKEFDKVYNDPKARSEIMSRLRDMYGQFDGEFMMDDFGVSFAVAEYLDDKNEPYVKQSGYYKMLDTYRNNVQEIASDIVGSFGDAKISAISGKGLFKTKLTETYRALVTRSLLSKDANDETDYWSRWLKTSVLEYAQDDMGGYGNIIGDRQKKFDQYCQSLADEFNKKNR